MKLVKMTKKEGRQKGTVSNSAQLVMPVQMNQFPKYLFSIAGLKMPFLGAILDFLI